MNSTAAITPEVIARHGITPDEYARIQELLGREPNLTELGVFSVMWSEHCSYKSSRVHLKTLPTEGKYVLQGPGENAGIIDVGGGWACVFKIESHNHPSYVEPFQGAATGVGGILRDVFTMGARPVAIMDSLRFGPLPLRAAATPRPEGGTAWGEANAEVRSRWSLDGTASGGGEQPGACDGETSVAVAARNHAILDGVVRGIAHYGNCFGVANLGGETNFEACYSGNPLVNAFALGIARQDGLFFGKASGVGNPILYVGAKTGRDGIHGATMASEEFNETSEAKRPNVQVGDPFLEKLLLEACLEAMQTGAIAGIQDMGAAGLTSSTCEMGARAGTGMDLDLDRVPQRDAGMSAYEMLLSESQERMLLVAHQGREEEVFRVFRKWGLDAAAVGVVTADEKFRVRHQGKVVAEIPNAALTDAAPRYRRPVKKPARTLPLDPQPAWLPGEDLDLNAELLALLASPNVCSKRWIYEQYDTMVRGNTLAGPGGDAGVIRLKGTHRALAMALDGNARYSRLDPREGAKLAVAEAARKVACTGAEPMAATNCLNYGNPEKPEVMWELAEAIAGMGEACRALETPITGGNVSLYNETLGRGIWPTPVIGVVGGMEWKASAARPAPAPLGLRFPAPGLVVMLLSGAPKMEIGERLRRFGGTEYAAVRIGRLWGLPPALDLERERELQRFLARANGRGWLRSAHQVSQGGLAVALAECCLARTVEQVESEACGVEIDLEGEAGDAAPQWLTWFEEPASRVVVSCAEENAEAVASAARAAGLDAVRLGQTTAAGFTLRRNGRTLADLALDALAEAWDGSLARQLEPEGATA